MASKRQQILEAFRDRLKLILIASGYDTDAGENVFLGEEVTLGPDDPNIAIAIDVGEDSVGQTHGPTPTLQIQLPIEIQAVAVATMASPWIAVEQVLSDIKKAIELNSVTWLGDLVQELSRGSTETLERGEGSTTVGTSITYTVLMFEEWGTP